MKITKLLHIITANIFNKDASIKQEPKFIDYADSLIIVKDYKKLFDMVENNYLLTPEQKSLLAIPTAAAIFAEVTNKTIQSNQYYHLFNIFNSQGNPQDFIKIIHELLNKDNESLVFKFQNSYSKTLLFKLGVRDLKYDKENHLTNLLENSILNNFVNIIKKSIPDLTSNQYFKKKYLSSLVKIIPIELYPYVFSNNKERAIFEKYVERNPPSIYMRYNEILMFKKLHSTLSDIEVANLENLKSIYDYVTLKNIDNVIDDEHQVIIQGLQKNIKMSHIKNDNISFHLFDFKKHYNLDSNILKEIIEIQKKYNEMNSDTLNSENFNTFVKLPSIIFKILDNHEVTKEYFPESSISTLDNIISLKNMILKIKENQEMDKISTLQQNHNLNNFKIK